MRRKKLAVFALMAAMVLSLAGCGKETKKNDKPVATTSNATATNAAANNLKDAFKDNFTVGVAVSSAKLQDEDIKKLVRITAAE